MTCNLKVSIITSTHNAEDYLRKLAGTIREQSVKPQWIVIDANSNDETISIIKENLDLIDYWISEKDDGIYDAWNKALRRVTGEWVLFLGADDFLWDCKTIEKFSVKLSDVPLNTDVAYGKVMLINEHADNIYIAGKSWEKIKTRFLQVMALPHQGVFHRSSLFKQYGEFDASFKIAGDYELLLRNLKNHDAFFIDEIVSSMLQGGISSTPKNAIKVLRESRRAQVKHGLKMPGFIWLAAYIRLIIRTWLWIIFGEKFTKKLLDFYRKLIGLPSYWNKC